MFVSYDITQIEREPTILLKEDWSAVEADKSNFFLHWSAFAIVRYVLIFTVDIRNTFKNPCATFLKLIPRYHFTS